MSGRSTLRLTPARPRDTATLARILQDGRGLHTDRTDRVTLRRLIEDGNVVTLRGWLRPHGFLAQSGATIHALYIAPEMRGRGLGRRLIDHAKAGQDRLDLWTAQSNAEARRFYARHGFFETAFSTGAANDENLPDVRLTWVRDGA